MEPGWRCQDPLPGAGGGGPLGGGPRTGNAADCRGIRDFVLCELAERDPIDRCIGGSSPDDGPPTGVREGRRPDRYSSSSDRCSREMGGERVDRVGRGDGLAG